MPRSFNYKIFRLVASLLVCTSLSILFSVWASTKAHVRQQAQNNLKVAESVLSQALQNSEIQLLNSAEVLTADFGFKQAVVSEDIPTIKSALINHSARISADVMALISLDGKIRSSTDNAIKTGEIFPVISLIETTLNQGGSLSFLEFNGHLYQIVLLTVDTPRPSAIAMVGFEIDKGFVNSLGGIVNLDVTIVSQNGATKPIIMSSLSETNLYKLTGDSTDTNTNTNTKTSKNEATSFNVTDYKYSQIFDIYKKENSHVFVILSQEINALLAQFNRLLIQITLITIFFIGIALILVIIFSKRLTRPLSRLSIAAKNIAKGTYSKEIPQTLDTKETNDLVIAFSQMQNSLKNREDEIVFRENHDDLTQLHNRFWVSHKVDERINLEQHFQAVIIDIISFRSVNDIYGYVSGDNYLKHISNKLNKLGGESARTGGGELIWLPEAFFDIDALTKIKNDLENENIIEGNQIANTLAFGLLNIPDDAPNSEMMFRRLSVAMEQAKKESALVYEYEASIEKKYLKRLHTVSELKRVLDSANNELNMNYQPKLRVLDKKVPKVEALIRWNGEQDGFIPPDYFIPLAEQSGLINTLTTWVIERVIGDVKSWQAQGLELCVAVNLSMRDIQNTQLLPITINLLAKANLPHSTLSFEITESEIMRDPASALEQLERYRAAGFDLSIDDFGTGYSSLSYLRTMPVSELKIDKSFVLNLAKQTEDQTIVKTIIALAHELNFTVVAEGVEDETALSLLEGWSCDWIQGYFISRPMPANNVVEWINAFRN